MAYFRLNLNLTCTGKAGAAKALAMSNMASYQMPAWAVVLLGRMVDALPEDQDSPQQIRIIASGDSSDCQFQVGVAS